MPKKIQEKLAETAPAVYSKTICKNKEAIIEGLKKYQKKHLLEKDHMRAKAYGTAIGALSSHNTAIKSE